MIKTKWNEFIPVPHMRSLHMQIEKWSCRYIISERKLAHQIKLKFQIGPVIFENEAASFSRLPRFTTTISFTMNTQSTIWQQSYKYFLGCGLPQFCGFIQADLIRN